MSDIRPEPRPVPPPPDPAAEAEAAMFAAVARVQALPRGPGLALAGWAAGTLAAWLADVARLDEDAATARTACAELIELHEACGQLLRALAEAGPRT